MASNKCGHESLQRGCPGCDYAFCKRNIDKEKKFGDTLEQKTNKDDAEIEKLKALKNKRALDRQEQLRLNELITAYNSDTEELEASILRYNAWVEKANALHKICQTFLNAPDPKAAFDAHVEQERNKHVMQPEDDNEDTGAQSTSASQSLQWVKHDEELALKTSKFSMADRSNIVATNEYAFDMPEGVRIALDQARRTGRPWNLSRSLGAHDTPAVMSVGATWHEDSLGPPALDRADKDAVISSETDIRRDRDPAYGRNIKMTEQEQIDFVQDYYEYIDLLLAYFGANAPKSDMARWETQSKSPGDQKVPEWDVERLAEEENLPAAARAQMPARPQMKRPTGPAKYSKATDPREPLMVERKWPAFINWVADWRDNCGGDIRLKAELSRWKEKVSETRKKVAAAAKEASENNKVPTRTYKNTPAGLIGASKPPTLNTLTMAKGEYTTGV